MGRLDGKVAFVSGGARGIGRETAELFAREGASVYVGDVNRPDSAYEQDVKFLELDVADESKWESVIDSVVGDAGRLDVLVNNAGVIRYEPILETSLRTWNEMLAVDLTGVFLGMRAALPHLIKSGRSAIVNFSSISGTATVEGAHAYHTAKGAIANMTRNVAVQHALDGVRANSVHPGYIRTPMTAVQSEEVSRSYAEATPMKRPGEAIEVAYVVLFLASDEASYVTGSEYNVDGGYLAR